MENYVEGEQIKISFRDGSQVTAKVISQDKDNLKCSALSKNEVYKEGDVIFCDIKNDTIEKLNIKKKSGNPNDNKFYHKDNYSIKKKSKRFNWEFDKHKPQWRINKESKEIEKDEDAISKVGRLKRKLAGDDNLDDFRKFLDIAKQNGYKTNYLQKYIDDGVRAFKNNVVLIAKHINNLLYVSVAINGSSEIEQFGDDIMGAFEFANSNYINKQSHKLDNDLIDSYSLTLSEMKEQFNQYLQTDEIGYLEDCVTNGEWIVNRLKEEIDNHDIVDIPRNYKNSKLSEKNFNKSVS